MNDGLEFRVKRLEDARDASVPSFGTFIVAFLLLALIGLGLGGALAWAVTVNAHIEALESEAPPR